MNPPGPTGVSRWKKPLSIAGACLLPLVALAAWAAMGPAKEGAGTRRTGTGERKNTSGTAEAPALRWAPLPDGPGKGPFLASLREPDGWITLDRNRFYHVKPIPAARGAVRCTIKWTENSRLLQLSAGPTGHVTTIQLTGKWVSFVGWNVPENKRLHPAPLQPGDERELCLAWIGKNLHAWAAGRSLGTFAVNEEPKMLHFNISQQSQKDPASAEAVKIRNVEWMDLSGIQDKDVVAVVTAELAKDPGTDGSAPGGVRGGQMRDAARNAPAGLPALAEEPTLQPMWKSVHASQPISKNSANVTQSPDGWVTITEGELHPVIRFGSGSHAIRARIGWTESKGMLQILTYMQSQLIVTGVGENTGGSWQGTSGKNLRGHNPPKGNGSEAILQLAWINGKHYTWIDGNLATELDIPTPLSSAASLIKNGGRTPIRVRDVETADLNSMTPVQALEFASKAANAGISPSVKPSVPATDR